MPIPVKTVADTLVPGVSTTGLQTDFNPHVTALVNGRFAILYSRGDVVPETTISLHAAAGGQLRSTIIPSINLLEYYDPAGAALADGNLMYAHTQQPQAGVFPADAIGGVYNQATGNRSVPFTLSTGAGLPDVDYFKSELVQLGNSHAATVWLNPASGSIYTNLFEANSGPVSAFIPVNTAAALANPTSDLGLAALANNNYVVTWVSATNEAKFRVFDGATGVAVTAETYVSVPATDMGGTDVIKLADGRFVVVYEILGAGIHGRIFTSSGTFSSSEFPVSAVGTAGTLPAVTALRDGRFMAAYNAGGDIWGRMMKADGTPDGAEFRLNTDPAGTQAAVTLDTLADGRIAVAWTDSRTGGGDVYYNIWEPREAGLSASATGVADDWIGTGFNDLVYLGAGNDEITLGAGADYAYGEAGQDRLSGDAGDDRLYGGNDNDLIFGGADADGFLSGGLGNDMVNGGAGNDRIDGGDDGDALSGDADADFITGGNGNDAIFGGTGAETFLDGGLGSDTINGGAGNDRIEGGADGDTLNGEADSDNITGGAGDDTINGGDEAAGGDVVLFGNAGADTVNGGTGDDRIDGGTENDILGGDAGADYITAGAGNDTITGGLGADTLLYGEAGLDTFVYTDDTEGNDFIRDWVAVDDTIRIDASAFGGGLAAGALAANRLVVSAAPVANQAFGQFLFTTGTGQLSWDADGTGAGAAVNICRLFNGAVTINTLAVGDFEIVA